MKQLINVFCLICIFLCGPFLEISYAQSATQIMELATQANDAGNYAQAALLYEKAYYFGTSEEKNLALESKALALKDMKRFDEALDVFRRMRLANLDTEKRFAIRYQMILCAYLSKQYGAAKSNLLLAEQEFKSGGQVKDLLFLKVLVANAMMDWDAGKTHLAELAQLSNWDSKLVNATYGEETPKIKDPNKAALWSTFIPGSGQIYAGSPGKGFLSAGTQALCFAYGLYHLVEKFYFTSFFTGFAFFQAFYFGGQQQAADLTELNNQRRAAEYNERIKQELILLRR